MISLPERLRPVGGGGEDEEMVAGSSPRLVKSLLGFITSVSLDKNKVDILSSRIFTSMSSIQ